MTYRVNNACLSLFTPLAKRDVTSSMLHRGKGKNLMTLIATLWTTFRPYVLHLLCVLAQSYNVFFRELSLSDDLSFD